MKEIKVWGEEEPKTFVDYKGEKAKEIAQKILEKPPDEIDSVKIRNDHAVLINDEMHDYLKLGTDFSLREAIKKIEE